MFYNIIEIPYRPPFLLCLDVTSRILSFPAQLENISNSKLSRYLLTWQSQLQLPNIEKEENNSQIWFGVKFDCELDDLVESSDNDNKGDFRIILLE